MKHLRITCLLLAFGIVASAQTKDSAPRNFSHGSTNPSTCNVGDLFFNSSSSAGQNIYGCTSSNTFTQQGGVGSGTVTTSGSPTTNVVPKFTGSTVIGNTSITDNGTTVVTTEPFSAPSVSTGASPPSITWGTGGGIGGAEGTDPTVACPGSGVDCIVFDSTQHGPMLSNNNGSFLPIPQAPASTTSGHLATFNASNGGLLADSGVVAAHIVYRTCDIAIGDESGSAITSSQLGPQSRICFIPTAATIVELDVNADAGTPNVIVGRNHAGTITNIVSGALATASSGGIACSNTGGTTGLNGATTCAGTLQNTSLSAGDYLELVSGTAGGTAKLFALHVTYSVN